MDVDSMLLGCIEEMLDQACLLYEQILLVLDDLLQLNNMRMTHHRVIDTDSWLLSHLLLLLILLRCFDLLRDHVDLDHQLVLFLLELK